MIPLGAVSTWVWDMMVLIKDNDKKGDNSYEVFRLVQTSVFETFTYLYAVL